MNIFKSTREKAFSVLEYIFFNRNRSLIFCLSFSAISFAAEIFIKIPALFSCSGAIVTIAGLFLNIKYSLNFHLKIPKKNLYNKLAGAGVFGASIVTEENLAWVDNIISDEIYGVSFMITGTIIWAYGQFLVNAINCI